MTTENTKNTKENFSRNYYLRVLSVLRGVILIRQMYQIL